MNIHEYQAKELLAKFGVAVPAGHAALTVDEAVAAAEQAPRAALCREGADPRRRPRQGQVQGTRPRRQGRRPPGQDARRGPRDRDRHARQHAGHDPDRRAGKQVNRLYITDGVDIAKEFYLAMLVDRETGRIAMVVSTEGGMDIETVAHDTPEKIHTINIDPATGFMPHHGRAVAFALGLKGDLAKQARRSRRQLYDAFLGTDAAQIEINPLVVTERRQAAGARRQGRLRFERAVPPQGPDASCATRPKRIRPRSRRRSTTSPISSSTAISAAWSTAPASPWRRWTSSSSTACSPPTSSTSAAAPPRRR